MVSMKDIARKCGVSVATVSKALNGQPDIGAETRERICAAAKEMGYMANAVARALKTNRTYNLGVLFVDEWRSGLGHEYFSTMLEGLKAEAESHGYDITFINSNLGSRSFSYLQHCKYRALDGIVIACVDFTDPRILELAESDIPLVTVDHVFPNRMAVLSDNASGIETLVHYAYDKGHRRIAYIHGEDIAVTRKRLEGFHKACRELGLQIPADYLVPSVYHDPDRCAEATRKLLALEQRPTCILFSDDYSFMGGYDEILEAGLQPFEDISAMGYDGINLARMMHLTTYTQQAAAIGKTAVQQLIRLIEQPDATPIEQVTVPGGLMEGRTVTQL